ncbi:MAG TPA: cation transporter [Microbacteriaceae bacterium]|jgi:copper chaperone CopZ|nr:cation transporter [Microbacteriaceae bacterium]HQX35809.1 cation transporter [Microbacteriaceae bacterium]HRA09714.1 cation transporter [Microbacteriaceae bacterium]
MTSNEIIDLAVAEAPSAGGGCCGGGGCGCSGGAAKSAPAVVSVRTDFAVEGMTCNHCVSSVTEELSEVEGVASVTVNLVESGTSTVSVHSAAPLSIPVLEAAIAEAGYTVVADPA